MNNDKIFKSVLVRGVLHFLDNAKYDFNGPMRKGIRPVVWYSESEKTATSFSLKSDDEIFPGDKKMVEIVILNELQLKQPIVKNMILNLGTIGSGKLHKFGEFVVLEYLGEWQGGKVS